MMMTSTSMTSVSTARIFAGGWPAWPSPSLAVGGGRQGGGAKMIPDWIVLLNWHLMPIDGVDYFNLIRLTVISICLILINISGCMATLYLLDGVPHNSA